VTYPGLVRAGEALLAWRERADSAEEYLGRIVRRSNLFTGGHEFHSAREWASVQEMASAAAVAVRLAGVWAERS